MKEKEPTSLLTTNIPQLKLCIRGKVRDIYEINESLLIVATDRISAFDVVPAKRHSLQREGAYRTLRILVSIYLRHY